MNANLRTRYGPRHYSSFLCLHSVFLCQRRVVLLLLLVFLCRGRVVLLLEVFLSQGRVGLLLLLFFLCRGRIVLLLLLVFYVRGGLSSSFLCPDCRPGSPFLRPVSFYLARKTGIFCSTFDSRLIHVNHNPLVPPPVTPTSVHFDPFSLF